MARASRAPRNTRGQQNEFRRDTKARNNARPEKEGYGKYHDSANDNSKIVIDPRTERQRILLSTINANTLTFATGPAGTGKTHIAVGVGVRGLVAQRKQFKRVIFSKPDVEIGEKLGTLPGDVNEKTAVRKRSMSDIASKLLGANRLERMEESGEIVFEPLGSILGLTFDDALVVLDEAQCITPEQMRAILTRIGERTKYVICGDFKEQKLSSMTGKCGLEDALERLEYEDSVGHVNFRLEDVVRSAFCKNVIRSYRDHDPEDYEL